jgi:hypothetical protein
VTIKNFVVKNGLTTGNILLSAGNSNISANYVIGNLSVPASANLGAVSNITITGGTSGQVLQTDGSGVLSWATPSGGGGSSSSISNGASNVSIPNINGNVIVGANGNAWTFDTTGNLSIPNNGGITSGTGQFILNDSGTPRVFITPNVTTGNASLILTDDHSYLTGNHYVYLQTSTASSLIQFQAHYQNWNFTSAGETLLPNSTLLGQGNISISTGNGGSPSITRVLTDPGVVYTGTNPTPSLSIVFYFNYEGSYSFDSLTSGPGFSIGDTVLYPGDLLSGTTPTNDATFTVVEIDIDGTILYGTFTGTHVNVAQVWDFTTNGYIQQGNGAFRLNHNDSTYLTPNNQSSNSYLYLSDTGSTEIKAQTDFNIYTGDGSNTWYFSDYGSTVFPNQQILTDGNIAINTGNQLDFGPISLTASGVIYTGSNPTPVFTAYFYLQRSGNYSVYNWTSDSGFSAGDTVFYPGTIFGGTSPANDCTITIASVGGSGFVENIDFAGTHVNVEKIWHFTQDGKLSAPGNISADRFIGNGSLLTDVTGANVTGYVPNANIANTAYAIDGANVSGAVGLATYATTANSVAGANVSGEVSFAATANSVAGANVSGQVSNALIAGTVYTNAQPNITSVGTLSSLNVTNDVTIGGNLTINGTTTTVNSTIVSVNDINIVLANNATSAALANGAGITINGAGANMLYINSTNSFTFSHKISADGGLLSNITGANITGFVSNANVANTAYSVAGSNVSGQVSYAAVANSVAGGNVSGAVGLATYATTANSVAGANVSGAVGLATYATTANSVAGGNVSGAVGLATYATTANSVAGGNVSGAVGLATYATTANSVAGGNVSGAVGLATYATTANAVAGANVSGQVSNALIAGTVYTNAQPNITSVGTLTGLTSNGTVNFTNTGNVSLGNISNVHITGGASGYILQTDGAGNLEWVDNLPSTITYSPNSITLTGGVYVSGNISSIQSFGDYAAGNVYVLTDGTGSAPAWQVDIDFIAVASFNRVVLNINYTQASGHTIYVELYNNTTSSWDAIGTYTGLGAYYAFALEVIDSAPYINGSSKAQLKLYHSNAGNAGHQTSIDYAALELSSQGPQGPRGPTGATGATGSGVATGGTTGQVLIKNSGSNYDTSWSSDLTSLGNVTLTGNIVSINANLGNLVTANYFSGNGSLLASLTGSNVTGQVSNSLVTGTVYTNAQPNITSIGTLSSLSVSGLITATGGGIKVGNIQDTIGTNTITLLSGNVTMIGNLSVGTGGTGNVTATYFIGNGSQLTGLPASYANANVAAYLLTYTGNITAGNIVGGNLVSANYFSGSGNLLSNIQGANVSGAVGLATYATTANSVAGGNVSGQVANSLVSGTVYTNAQPNITSVGTLTGLTVSGDTTLTGNLTVSGSFEYANVTSFKVKDPIIEQGGNPNGTALSSNDGYDRGQLLHYYAGATVDAFMGWDNSNSEFAFGSNVTVASEVVTFNTFGNVRAGYFIGNGSQLTGTIANANYALYAGTVTTAAQPNITSVGTLSSLAVTANITAGNISGGNLVSANYHSGDGSLLTSLSGANVSGQVANSLVAGTVYTNAQPNITSVGSLSSLTVSGLITATGGGLRIGNIKDTSGTNTISLLSGNVSMIGDLSIGTSGSGNLTVTGNSNLGPAGNVKITGGTTGQYLKTDGTGNLTWATVTGGGGSGSGITYTAATSPPGTSNVADQWYNTTTNTLYEYVNDGSANYWVDIQTPTVSTPGTQTVQLGFNTRTYTGTGSLTTFAVSLNLTASSVIVSLNGVIQVPTTDYTISGATLTFTTAPGAGVAIQIRELANQIPYILANYNTVGSLVVASNTTTSNLTITGNTTSTGNLTLSGANLSLGPIANIHITGGSTGQFVTTDGAGNLSFSTVSIPSSGASNARVTGYNLVFGG